jgi:hypothetical protein
VSRPASLVAGLLRLLEPGLQRAERTLRFALDLGAYGLHPLPVAGLPGLLLSPRVLCELALERRRTRLGLRRACDGPIACGLCRVAGGREGLEGLLVLGELLAALGLLGAARVELLAPTRQTLAEVVALLRDALLRGACGVEVRRQLLHLTPQVLHLAAQLEVGLVVLLLALPASLEDLQLAHPTPQVVPLGLKVAPLVELAAQPRDLLDAPLEQV